jgi:hypothetical protein
MGCSFLLVQKRDGMGVPNDRSKETGKRTKNKGKKGKLLLDILIVTMLMKEGSTPRSGSWQYLYEIGGWHSCAL